MHGVEQRPRRPAGSKPRDARLGRSQLRRPRAGRHSSRLDDAPAARFAAAIRSGLACSLRRAWRATSFTSRWPSPTMCAPDHGEPIHERIERLRSLSPRAMLSSATTWRKASSSAPAFEGYWIRSLTPEDDACRVYRGVPERTVAPGPMTLNRDRRIEGRCELRTAGECRGRSPDRTRRTVFGGDPQPQVQFHSLRRREA